MKLFENISFNWEDFLFDLYISDDRFADLKSYFDAGETKIVTANVMSRLFRYGGFSYDALKEDLLKTKSHRTAVLDAHEDGSRYSEWCYVDGMETIPVQAWIDKASGEDYGALIIGCCNSCGLHSIVRKIPIFYADGVIGITQKYNAIRLEP